MKNRIRQRENRRLKHHNEKLSKRNAYGNKDLTAYNAVRQIQTDGRAGIDLGQQHEYIYEKPTKRKMQPVPGGGFSMPGMKEGSETE